MRAKDNNKNDSTTEKKRLENLCSALFGQLEMLLEAIGSQQRCLATHTHTHSHRKYDYNTQTALLIFNKVAPRFNQPKFC